jgi:hypothetical protein
VLASGQQHCSEVLPLTASVHPYMSGVLLYTAPGKAALIAGRCTLAARECGPRVRVQVWTNPVPTTVTPHCLGVWREREGQGPMRTLCPYYREGGPAVFALRMAAAAGASAALHQAQRCQFTAPCASGEVCGMSCALYLCHWKHTAWPWQAVQVCSCVLVGSREGWWHALSSHTRPCALVQHCTWVGLQGGRVNPLHADTGRP